MGINALSVISADEILLYTITFTNRTQDVIDVMVTFRRKDQEAYVVLKNNWSPGETRVFDQLCECWNMEAYTISCFNPALPEPDRLIFYFPGPGEEMTPAKARLVHPACTDSWAIEEVTP